jgi:hypothetical protein
LKELDKPNRFYPFTQIGASMALIPELDMPEIIKKTEAQPFTVGLD